MDSNLGVLIVEDSEDDTLLEVRQIELAGYVVDYERVETKADLESALSAKKWDVVLCDFTMPQFTGVEVLKIVRGKDSTVPFIFISGTIGEDRASDALRNGANHYIDKLDAGRLVASIERELERRDLSARMRTELAPSEEPIDAITLVDLLTGRVYPDKSADELYGLDANEKFANKLRQITMEHSNEPGKIRATTVSEEQGRSMIIDDPVRKACEITLSTGYWEGELEQLTRNGKDAVVSSRWHLLRSDTGNQVFIAVVNRDNTKQKMLEARTKKAQRAEILGTLAAGIAHDLNNIMTPLVLGLEMLHRKHAGDEKMMKLIATLQSTVDRGTGVVKQIVAFAKGSDLKREILDASVIVEDLKHAVGNILPKSIRVDVVELATRPFFADGVQIHQALINLCIYAGQVMPNGGTLGLFTKDVTLDDTNIGATGEAIPGRYVLIQVSNTGTGINKEDIEKLFNPNVATRLTGGTLGLSLSITREVVENHGGLIEVRSDADKGSTFSIYLPAIPDHTVSPTMESNLATGCGRGELILVVEDETAIRDITKATLEAEGYRVVVAKNGKEALTLFNQCGDEVMLVVTDMAMPVMDGPATIRDLKDIKPHLKIIAATAHPDSIKQHGLERSIISLLRKPYTANSLLKAVNSGIAASGQG